MIADNMDLCPNIAERYNGYFDTDGCPDQIPVSSLSDADFDGIVDTLDDCKYQQETYNQFQDKTVALILFLMIILSLLQNINL